MDGSLPGLAAVAAPVFVIDDDEAYRELLAIALEDHCGVGDLRAFADGAAGLAALQALPAAAPPQLVLLDVHMPGLGGLAVLRALRARGLAHRVLVISSAASPEERRQCEAEGARFLHKPARFEDLLAALRPLLARPAPLREGARG